MRVFELLRDSGKPAVGHNCFFDLAFTLEHLAEPLPEEWPDFKRLVQKWFPGACCVVAWSSARQYADSHTAWVSYSKST